MKRFRISNPKSAVLHSSSGFTLVELAIVLVVIGLLIGLGASIISPLTKRAKYIETKDIVSAAVESVISFAASNNRLPCEANDNNGRVCGPPGNWGDEFTPTVRNPNDAWAKAIYYIYDNNLTQKVQLNFCVAGINTLKPFVFNGIISMLCCNLHNLCCIKICRQRLQHSMFKGFQDKGFSGIKACFFRAKRTFWVN